MTVRKIVIIEEKTTLKKDESEELRMRRGKMKRGFFSFKYFSLILFIFVNIY